VAHADASSNYSLLLSERGPALCSLARYVLDFAVAGFGKRSNPIGIEEGEHADDRT
jgi:hypothetical protein